MTTPIFGDRTQNGNVEQLNVRLQTHSYNTELILSFDIFGS